MVQRLDTVSDELVAKNELTNAKVYWQITRGSAPRDPVFPKGVSPTVLAIAYPAKPLDASSPPAAMNAVLAEDIRWHQCSIKSLQLLPNVLTKNIALEAGVDEAILHRDGHITESTATSVFIVRITVSCGPTPPTNGS